MPLLRWNRKAQELADFEDQIFSCLPKQPQREYILLKDDPDRPVWTLNMPHDTSSKLPLVMLHGLGAGIGLWLKNLSELSTDRSLYAFDLPGFGRSFRVKNQSFKTAEEAEEYFVDAIESWRQGVALNDFILLGHSFGGYLASAYALKYPHHVKGIILVDAWGFSKRTSHELSRKLKIGLSVYNTISPNPLSLLRAAGSWGPSLISRCRPDIVRKYQLSELKDGVIVNYVYLCNAQEPSGEIAFKSMVGEMGLAVRPMVERVGDIRHTIPIAMLYGKESWIDHSICEQVKCIRGKSFVHIELISGAGHHLYADQPDLFNHLVSHICLKFEDLPNSLVNNHLLDNSDANNSDIGANKHENTFCAVNDENNIGADNGENNNNLKEDFNKEAINVKEIIIKDILGTENKDITINNVKVRI